MSDVVEGRCFDGVEYSCRNEAVESAEAMCFEDTSGDRNMSGPGDGIVCEICGTGEIAAENGVWGV